MKYLKEKYTDVTIEVSYAKSDSEFIFGGKTGYKFDENIKEIEGIIKENKLKFKKKTKVSKDTIVMWSILEKIILDKAIKITHQINSIGEIHFPSVRWIFDKFEILFCSHQGLHLNFPDNQTDKKSIIKEVKKRGIEFENQNELDKIK